MASGWHDDHDPEGMEDWRWGVLGRAGAASEQPLGVAPAATPQLEAAVALRPETPQDARGDPAVDDDGNEPEGLEDWRWGALGRAGAAQEEPLSAPPPSAQQVSAAVSSDPSARRGGPAMDDYDDDNEPEGMEDWRWGALGRAGAAQEEPLSVPPAGTPPASATTAQEANVLQAPADGTESVEAGATAGAATEEELVQRFRETHNQPSTPARSLTGEVRPQTIWGYWDQGYADMPDLFKLCVDSWRRCNPSWDVRILGREAVPEFLSDADLPNRFAEIQSPETAADCVRLALLARYGGVWLDVSVILRSSLETLCWRAIHARRHRAAAFFHPRYSSPEPGAQDFMETWFLAAIRGDPLVLQWRDLVKELMHNRTGVEGLLTHPLYAGQGLDTPAQGEATEHLLGHAMLQRLLTRDPRAGLLLRESWLRMDAAATTFRLQELADDSGRTVDDLLLAKDPEANSIEVELDGMHLIKLPAPRHAPALLRVPREQLLNGGALLGRLLHGRPRTGTAPARVPVARPAVDSRARVNAQRAPKRSVSTAACATVCVGLGATAPLWRGCRMLQLLRRVVPRSRLPWLDHAPLTIARGPMPHRGVPVVAGVTLGLPPAYSAAALGLHGSSYVKISTR